MPGAASVCEIGGNLEYEVIGRTADTSWYELRVNCSGAWVEGWLPAEYGIFRNPAGLDVPVTWFR